MSKKVLLLGFVTLFFINGCLEEKAKEEKFYGNIDVRTVSLAFRVSGKIKNIYFEEGEKIKQGDVIASLDDALYKEYIKQTDAQIEMQKAKVQKLEKGYRKEEIAKAQALFLEKEVALKKAKVDLKRHEELLSSHSISQQKYDDIKAAYDNANALYLYAKSSLDLLKNGYEKEDILAAKAQLDYLTSQKVEQEINLHDTKIYAPSNGTLLTRVYEPGSIVNSSQVVIEMAKDDQYWVRSYMSERYLGVIKQGMKALVYTDSRKGKAYEGTVSFISPLAEFTPKNVQTEELRTDLVYRFRIILKEYDEMIRQGMPVTIEFPNLNRETE
jgi:HlyD family secretion protein